jgi:hypothetical protein
MLEEEKRKPATPGHLTMDKRQENKIDALVLRQNISRDQIGTFLGREGLNTILASTQREAFGRQEPLCACGARMY